MSPSFSVLLTPNPEARQTTPDKLTIKIKSSQVLKTAVSRDLESLSYSFAVVEKSTTSPERENKIKAAIR